MRPGRRDRRRRAGRAGRRPNAPSSRSSARRHHSHSASSTAFARSVSRYSARPRLPRQIESSKVFAKQLMIDAGVPTARAERHTDPPPPDAPQRVRRAGGHQGLRPGGGQGRYRRGDGAPRRMRRSTRCSPSGVFGAAGAEILVEEYMHGEEVSLHFLTNGTQWVPVRRGAGSQAAPRRRQGTQHRRHGRVRACAHPMAAPLARGEWRMRPFPGSGSDWADLVRYRRRADHRADTGGTPRPRGAIYGSACTRGS